MIYIYLGAHSSWYKATTFVTTTVTSKDYTCSNLFKIYNHKLNQHTGGYIYIYKVDSYIKTIMKNCAILQPGEEYKNSKLVSVDVYVNRFDSTNSKLLVVFYFNHSGSKVENKYYTFSELEPLINSYSSIRINSLDTYKDDPSILCALLHENDRLTDFLTYDIMQRPNNGDGTPCTYNCGKIEVTDTTNKGDSSPKLTNGFRRYCHKSPGGAKKACVIYNCQALLKENSGGKTELTGVQGGTYIYINVYFGSKAKREGLKTCTLNQGSKCPREKSGGDRTCPAATTGDGNPQDVPLMLELHRNGQPDYYVHRKNSDQYYWVKLTLDNGNEEPKELLKDIGLSKEQEQGNGTTLQSKLGEKPNGSDDGPTYLDLLLRRIEFDLTDSMVILMERKKGSTGDYGRSEIIEAISTLQTDGKTKSINWIKLKDSRGSKLITVADKTNGLCECLTKHKYRVVQHDFQNAVNGKLTSGCSAGMRFLIHTSKEKSGTYRELKVYSTNKTQTQHLEYKYYTRNGESSGHNCHKVHVVFYQGTGGGTESDPRPLLLCYQKEVYRAISNDGYDKQQWVKVTGLTLKKCLCQNEPSGGTDYQDKLLGAVTEVVGFLNQINLWNHPGGTSKDQGCTTQPVAATTTQCQAGTTANTCKYTVHTYNGKQVNVQVKCEAVPGRSIGISRCYMKLTHRPIGTSGKSATNANNNFRLGNVVYCQNSKRQGKIDYYQNGGTNGDLATNRWAPLVAVSAYFYTEDKTYQDPLLVVLEFAKVNGLANNRECYKLKKTDDGNTLTWQKDTETACQKDDAKLVTHLDKIRLDLKKTIRIRLEYNGTDSKNSYPLEVRVGTQNTGSVNGFKAINNGQKQVSVKVHDCRCPKLSDSKYKCVKHDLTNSLIGHQHEVAGLSFTIPGPDNKGSSNSEIRLNNSRSDSGETRELYYNKCKGDIYVYFYGSDPRPLLLCYGEQVYRANSKDDYDAQKWTKDNTVTKCDCNGQGGGGGKNDQLLKALASVVGFLNTVQLQKHPNGTATGDQACTTGSTAAPATAQCQPGTDAITGSTCKYEVHKYKGQAIQVQVECCPVKANGSSCYRKLKHTPIGTNGPTSSSGNGFRLGDIVYCQNGREQGRIDYYGNGSANGLKASDQNRWAPLVAVHAYFYTEDTKYEDPLLVVLEFAKNGLENKGTEKECYRLKTATGSLAWEKYDEVKSLVGTDNGKLTQYLDSIRYCLKLVVKIELQHNGTLEKTSYKLMGRDANGTGTGDFKPINNGKQVRVEVHECPALKGSNYKCVKHDLTNSLIGHKHEVAGLTFTLPGKSGGTAIEIPLDQNGVAGAKVTCSNGKPGSVTIPPVYYNSCMGDLCVFFYDNATDDVNKLSSGDSRPGLLCLNNQAYRPPKLAKLDEQNNYNSAYYNKWTRVLELTKCCCEESEELIKILDEIFNLEETNIALIAGSSTGGSVGVVSIGGILFFIFKKVKATSTVAAAAATLTL